MESTKDMVYNHLVIAKREAVGSIPYVCFTLAEEIHGKCVWETEDKGLLVLE